jgi:hypothetical protein
MAFVGAEFTNARIANTPPITNIPPRARRIHTTVFDLFGVGGGRRSVLIIRDL